MTSVVVVVLMCSLVFGLVRPEGDTEDVLQKPEVDKAHERNGTEDDQRQAWKKCFHKFSTRCVALSLVQLVSHLPPEGLRVAPGVRLVAEPLSSTPPRPLPPLRTLLGGLSLRMEPQDPALLRRVKVLSEEVVDRLVASEITEGRKKGGGGALLWSAGALAAVGFASLAAVAGKALMASMMALMLAAMSALRGAGGGSSGGGGGHKSSTVEIIKAPAHIELAPAHYEASQYDHDHYYAAPSYEYGRTLTRPKTDSAPSATALYSKQLLS